MPTKGLSAVVVIVVTGQSDSTLFNTGLAMNPFAVLAVNGTQGLAIQIGDNWVGKTAAMTV